MYRPRAVSGKLKDLKTRSGSRQSRLRSEAAEMKYAAQQSYRDELQGRAVEWHA